MPRSRCSSDFDELAAVLDDFGRRGLDALFVSSGDGTVQCLQTDLAERKPYARLPRLALLAHGTTNMTAADLGFAVRDLERIADVIRRPEILKRATAVKRRATLRIVNPRGRDPQHGMFFGAGAISRAVRFCHEKILASGLKGDWATAATLAAALAKAAFKAPDPDDAERIDQPYRMEVVADGLTRAAGSQLLFLATTLDKLILASRPFWGRHQTALRATAIAYPPPPIARHVLSLLYGAGERGLPAGCVSFSASAIALTTETTCVLDGEFLEPPANAPLRIELGPEFEYLTG